MQSCFLSKPRRAERKIQKAMKLDPERFKTDTIFIKDTVLIETYIKDTVREIIYHDTVTVINNEKVRLKYFYDTTRLEIWHEVECHGDTVFINKEVIVDKVIEKDSNGINYYVVLIVALLIMSLLCLYLIIKRDKK